MQSYFHGGQTDYEHNPELDALLQRLLGGGARPAKPGDKKGGKLEGQRDQLQKLPNGKMQGHGGEYVVNAEATDAFGPLLEQLNRSVPAKAKGKKPEKPSKGKGYWGGGDSGAGEGETGPGPGESGPGASTSGVGEGTNSGVGATTGDPSSAGGIGASTAGATSTTGHSVSNPQGGGIGAALGGDSPTTGMDPGINAAISPDDAQTAAVAGSGWRGQDPMDAIKGFLAAIMPSLFGPSPLTAGQKGLSTAIGFSPTPPGTGLAVRGLMGSAQNAIAARAAENSARSGFTSMQGGMPSMGSMGVAAADIAGTPGVGEGSGPPGGAGNALPAELQALDALQQEEKKVSRSIGRSPMEEGLYDLAGRGMQGQNPWALAEAAKPFAGNQSMDSLLAQARKFFAV